MLNEVFEIYLLNEIIDFIKEPKISELDITNIKNVIDSVLNRLFYKKVINMKILPISEND